MCRDPVLAALGPLGCFGRIAVLQLRVLLVGIGSDLIGGPLPELSRELRLRLHVLDQGVGIPPLDQRARAAVVAGPH